MRRRLVPLILMTIIGGPLAAGADPTLTQASCYGNGPGPTVSLFKQVDNDVLENLGFDGLGYMWVSDSTKGAILRYNAAGDQVTSIPVPSPGAITKGPDDFMYVNAGDALAGALGKTHQAAVYKFDPALTSPALTLVSSGWNMANGATFDGDGHLWTSNDVDRELVKIDAVTGATQTVTDVWGTNGLIYDDGTVYAAITFDQRSPIEAVPVANPASHYTYTELTVGGASLEPEVRAPGSLERPLIGVKGLDDMTLVGDQVYAVANGMGELLRVPLGSPGTLGCLVASGLHNPSSVRMASGFGEANEGALFVTEFSGRILRVELP